MNNADLALAVIELYVANNFDVKIVSGIEYYVDTESWGVVVHYNDSDAYQVLMVTDEFISDSIYMIEE